MNYALQNIVAVVLILVSVFVAAYFLLLRQDGQYIPESWGELGCMHPVYVKQDNLQPQIQKGVLFFLNQCIDSKDNLQVGDIIYFEGERDNRLGVIEEAKKDYYIVNIGLDGKVEVQPDLVLAYTRLLLEE